MRPSASYALLFTLNFSASAVQAQDYLSVAEGPAILYDAPSTQAKKLFVGSSYLPLEQVVSLSNWVKVRDSSGTMAWIEKQALSNKRFVVVTAAIALVRQTPDDATPIVFQARQQVALEWLERTGTGWIKVRHTDGMIGYVSMTDVWGG